jgi:DNA-binding response OmpR family regulator
MPKVLLLDTEPHLFSLLKAKLEREGFEVFADEVTLAAQASPDLVILGQRHPHDTLVLGSNTPIILLSPSDSQAESHVPHLKMPFRPNDLVELARRTVTV